MESFQICKHVFRFYDPIAAKRRLQWVNNITFKIVQCLFETSKFHEREEFCGTLDVYSPEILLYLMKKSVNKKN